MKKIDWYIFKKYLTTFIFIMVLLIAITIVIDISEKIDSLLGNDIPFKAIVFDYYMGFIPFISSLLAPFFILVAVIFFTSQLADRSEIIAILNSGTSFYRMLLPYFYGALFFATLLYIGNHYVIPEANKKRIEFEGKYIYKVSPSAAYNFHRMVAPGEVIYMESYKPYDATSYRFSMEKFVDGALVKKIRCDRIEWQKDTKKWRLNNYYIRTLKGEQFVLEKGDIIDLALPFQPDNFNFISSTKETMTTPQLIDHINSLRKAGMSNLEFYEVERHRRTSIPFSIFIMTLIGVSLASQKVRGGLGWHLVLGIGLSAAYEIIMKFSVTFSTNSSLPAFMGVWIPNIIFGGIAAYLLVKAPK
jgi:lipopolysaccharide export system permease protein